MFLLGPPTFCGTDCMLDPYMSSFWVSQRRLPGLSGSPSQPRGVHLFCSSGSKAFPLQPVSEVCLDLLKKKNHIYDFKKMFLTGPFLD